MDQIRHDMNVFNEDWISQLLNGSNCNFSHKKIEYINCNEHNNFDFLPFTFLNVDNSINIPQIFLNFCVFILDNVLEGTVSPILYLVPGSFI